MEVRPFRAFRFNPTVVGDVSACIAPPYDVIDAGRQKELHAKNQYNIVHATLGIKTPDDSPQNNVYTRAAEFMRTALADRALMQDAAEALYAYVQDFNIAEKRFQRSGIVALGKLEPFGRGVQPHEKTLEGPKADRLNLTRATATQFGQIFMLYDDPTKTAETVIRQAMAAAPLIDCTDAEYTRHRLYAIRDAALIETFVAMMADKSAVIADGHHRYETALNYWAETKNPNAAWQMMTLVNMHNEGLVIQPTHRLVHGLPDFSVGRLLEDLRPTFAVQAYPFAGETEKADALARLFDRMKQSRDETAPVFGLYAADGAFYSLTLADPGAMERKMPHASCASRTLDVNVLHSLILEPLLGIGEEKLARESNIEYIKDLGDAIETSVRLVDTGKAQAVFFVNPTRIEQVQAVAAAGEKMPQKSTFFYPKLYSGLTIHRVAELPLKESKN
jgi:uncharacterized protein (DUF1015 family)